MSPILKARGLWDQALFELVASGVTFGALIFLFWLRASDGVGRPDAALAFGAAVVFAFVRILVRREDKAAWIEHPSRLSNLLVVLGGLGWLFGALYADTLLFHRKDITSHRVVADIFRFAVLAAALLWSMQQKRTETSPKL
jgi:ABC-type Fe3+-siderophore transport system permease subunit